MEFYRSKSVFGLVFQSTPEVEKFLGEDKGTTSLGVDFVPLSWDKIVEVTCRTSGKFKYEDKRAKRVQPGGQAN